jgi:hypothetical protein
MVLEPNGSAHKRCRRPYFSPMIRENRQLVKDEPVELEK